MCETCGEEVNFPWGKSISYLTALLRNLPALWHFNGAGIGGTQVGTTLAATTTPEDQEDAVERVEVA
jgi:hypothetical protein